MLKLLLYQYFKHLFPNFSGLMVFDENGSKSNKIGYELKHIIDCVFGRNPDKSKKSIPVRMLFQVLSTIALTYVFGLYLGLTCGSLGRCFR